MIQTKQRNLYKVSFIIVMMSITIIASACQRRAESGLGLRMSTVPTSQSLELTTIRFAVADAEIARFESLIQRFEQGNQDLEVELVSIEANLRQQPEADSWGVLARTADAFAYSPLVEGTEQRVLYDLTPLIAADTLFDAQDFFPAAWSGVQWQEGVWGVPIALNTPVIFYNRDHLTTAGLHDPQPNWTMADFSTLATTLAKKADETNAQYGFVPHAAVVNTELIMRKAGLYGDTSAIALDDPRVVQAVDWYRELIHNNIIPNPLDGDHLVGRRELIEDKRAAMWSGTLADLAHFAPHPEIGVTLLPCGEQGQCHAEWNIIGYAMSAFTNQPQATWRWLAFLTRQTPEQLTGKAHLLPARRSIAERNAFWQKVPQPVGALLQSTLANVASAPSEAVPYLRRDEMHNALLDILKDNIPATSRLASAQKAVQDRIRAAERAQPGPVVDGIADAPTAANERITIMFAVDHPEDRAIIRDLAEEYERQQGTVHVEVVPPRFQPGSRDFGIPALADRADCFVWYGESQEEAYADNLMSLDPFLEQDTGFAVDDLYPQWVSQFHFDGQQWAIPASISPAVLLFNRELFAANRVAVPSADWDLDDFLAAAAALTDPERQQFGFVPNADWTSELVFFLNQHAGTLVDFQQVPPHPRFADPEIRQALRWYLDLARLNNDYPAFRVTAQSLGDDRFLSNWALARTTLIQEGKIAMWIELPAYYGGQPIDTKSLEVGVAPLPNGKGRTNIASATGYFISQKTEQAEACWQWISFLTRQTMRSSGVPARRSVAESTEYRNVLGVERAQAYVSTVATTGPSDLAYLGQKWLVPWFRWFLDACTQALAGADVDLTLDQAQERAQQYRGCIAERSGFTNTVVWRECLAQVDPSFPASPW